MKMVKDNENTSAPNLDTPMMRQYFELKRKYPGMLLFFRLGDFYELFEDDAREVSALLGLTLTHRVTVPMCGVPYHAAESYINKLVRMRRRVAICDQMEDPKKAKGLVKRAITRIVTPATNLDDEQTQKQGHNFLAAVYLLKAKGRETYGAAFLDVATGSFEMTELKSQEELLDELKRQTPTEILYAEGEESLWAEPLAALSFALSMPIDNLYFDDGYNVLVSHFGVASLAGFGCEDKACGVMCAGAALRYVKEKFVMADLDHIMSLRTYEKTKFMRLSDHTRRNLELVRSLRENSAEGTLLSVLDETKTPMGARLLRTWLLAPLLDKTEIERRYDALELLMSRQGELCALKEELKNFGDLEKLVSKLSTGYGTPRDLLGLRYALRQLPKLKELLGQALLEAEAEELVERAGKDVLLRDIFEKLRPDPELTDTLDRALSDDPPLRLQDGGIIKDGFDSELDEIRRFSKDGRDLILEMQSKEAERTGIKKLKVGYTKVFGYYIEVTKSNLDLVPDNYIRKQTVVNGERFITPELKELESKLLHAEEQSLEREAKIFQDLRQAVLEKHRFIQESADAVARLDVLLNIAWISLQRDYRRPKICEDDRLVIKAGRHPVVERLLSDKRFVPNDTHLNTTSDQIMLITGPNMAGKSTYIRQVALLVLMAQSGFFIPADSAEIGLADQIFTRVGASDELSRGQSTFMVEMTETANILHNATPRSLIILDEIGRGTSTYDGLAIAWAVVDYLHSEAKVKARTLFATHYHELIRLESLLPGVVNYNVAVWEDGKTVSFLHEIVRGGTNRSYGIHVAKLAGLPAPVVERAEELLESFERGRNVRNAEPALPETPDAQPPAEEEVSVKARPEETEKEKESPDAPAPEEAGETVEAPPEDAERSAFEEELKKDEPGTVSQLELF